MLKSASWSWRWMFDELLNRKTVKSLNRKLTIMIFKSLVLQFNGFTIIAVVFHRMISLPHLPNLV